MRSPNRQIKTTVNISAYTVYGLMKAHGTVIVLLILYSVKFWCGETLAKLTSFANILPSQIPDLLK